MDQKQIEKFLNLGYDIGYDLVDYTKDVLFLDDLRKVLRDGVSLETFIKVYGFKRSSSEIRNLRTLCKYKLEIPDENRFVLDAVLEEEALHIYGPIIIKQLKAIDLTVIKSKPLAYFIIGIIKKGYSADAINNFLKAHAAKFPNELMEHYIVGFLQTSRALEKANVYIKHMTDENFKLLYRYVFVDDLMLTNDMIKVINSNKYSLKERDLILLKLLHPDFINKLDGFIENNLFIKNGETIGYKNLSHEQGYKYNSVINLPLNTLPDSGLTVEQLIMIIFISKEINPNVESNKIYVSNYIDLLEWINKFPVKSEDTYLEMDLSIIPYELKGLNTSKVRNYPVDLAVTCCLLELFGLDIGEIDFEVSRTVIPYIIPTTVLGIDIFKLFSFWIDSIDEETRILECIYVSLWGGKVFDLVDEGINIQKVKNTRYALTQLDS